MEPPGRIADHLAQPRLDIHMDVFVFVAEGKLAALDFFLDFAEAGNDFLGIRFRDDALLAQHFGMRLRPGNILSPQALSTPIETLICCMMSSGRSSNRPPHIWLLLFFFLLMGR
jgi:hypothetical protein